MALSGFFSQLNIKRSCRAYGLPLWQCPHFLFLVMGLVIIVSILFSYALGSQYVDNPEIAALITILLAGVLLIISFVITNSFERLAEANRLKSEFVSIVSHQLRSPLSNLKWGLEMLMSGRTGKVQDGQVSYLAILKENSDRMQELVNHLLVVSRIQEGTLKLAKEKFSFKELLQSILLEFDPWIRASNSTIALEEQDDGKQIFSDPMLVRQVVQNFLENAMRYGAGAIRVRYAIRNSRLRFEVIDNGVGIPQEDQKHIFQKFFRSSNALRNETQGSGLGLYIAKSMIEKLGGKIGFTSAERKGSTFWFSLPIT